MSTDIHMQHTSTSIYEDIILFLNYLKQMGATGADITQGSLQSFQKWETSQKSSQRIRTTLTKEPLQKQPPPRIERQNHQQQTFKNTADDTLIQLLKTVKTCTKCDLHKTRTQIVFGAGNPKSNIVFVGESPGLDENKSGKPFAGEAGQLLTRIIKAMHLNHDMVYICNIMKCLPPNNRVPEPEEIKACLGHLKSQLDIIQPDIICTLGSSASQALLNVKTSIDEMRGRFYDYKGIPVMPTFHPSYLLRHASKKKEVWHDMQLVMKKMQDNIT